MVAILTAVLMTAAEISNLFSVVGVLICFICMVVFILRLQGGDMFGTSVVHIAQPVARVAYQKVYVPFSLHLCNSGEATYADVQLAVRSDVNYSLRSFWGVPSAHLHLVLTAPWSTFFSSLMGEEKEREEEVKEGQKVEEIEKLLEAEVTDEVVREYFGERVKQVGLSSSHLPLMLGSSPRTVYPLVVCVVRQEEPEDENDLSGVGALINIIHIKDTECPMSTCVLHQYIKQYSGQLTKLQALYTQGSSSTEGRAENKGTYGAEESEKKDEQEEKTEQNPESRECPDECSSEKKEEEEEDFIPLEEACVVCQTKRITRALLPCRHVCTCNTCFSRLNTCPMCRAPIRAYFLVAPETSGLDEERDGEVHEVANTSVWQRIGNTMVRLFRLDEHLLRDEVW